MINKEFAPFEYSLKMKKLGFNEECFGVYVNGHFEPRYRSKNSKFNPNSKLDKIYLEYCTAPLWQQSFDWLLNNKKLFSYIRIFNHYDFGFSIFKVYPKKELLYSSNYYDSIEEARLACLEKLIEIVENDQQRN